MGEVSKTTDVWCTWIQVNSAVQFEEILQSYIDAVNREPEEVDIIVFYFSGLADDGDEIGSDSSIKTDDDDEDDDEDGEDNNDWESSCKKVLGKADKRKADYFEGMVLLASLRDLWKRERWEFSQTGSSSISIIRYGGIEIGLELTISNDYGDDKDGD